MLNILPNTNGIILVLIHTHDDVLVILAVYSDILDNEPYIIYPYVTHYYTVKLYPY